MVGIYLDSLNFKVRDAASEKTATFFAVTLKEKKSWLAAFENAITLAKEIPLVPASSSKPSPQRLSLRLKAITRAYSNRGGKFEELSISAPTSMTPGVHVDRDFIWTNIDEKSFDLEALLGEGSFGSVYKAVHRETSKKTRKRVDKSD